MDQEIVCVAFCVFSLFQIHVLSDMPRESTREHSSKWRRLLSMSYCQVKKSKTDLCIHGGQDDSLAKHGIYCTASYFYFPIQNKLHGCFSSFWFYNALHSISLARQFRSSFLLQILPSPVCADLAATSLNEAVVLTVLFII